MPLIRCEVHVAAPPGRCFDLARSVDLHVDSSTEIAARAVGGRCHGLSAGGDVTVWSARFLGVRSAMTTRVDCFDRPHRFGDTLDRGLLRRFSHVYRFVAVGDGCLMSDELDVQAPLGPLGRVAERLYLTRRMTYLVRVRLDAIKAVAEGDDWHRYLPDRPA